MQGKGEGPQVHTAHRHHGDSNKQALVSFGRDNILLSIAGNKRAKSFAVARIHCSNFTPLPCKNRLGILFARKKIAIPQHTKISTFLTR